ncbi:MAG TPA: hypothetical protein DCY40_03890 [Actinobacteria bacterium]|nr:hypothetical protein [Actinomycetota bacterium]
MSFGASGDPKARPSGGCVRVVAAAGTPSKDVLCFDEEEFDTGPQLAFLPDGRLQVTMFSRPPEQPLMTAWQKIVDVRTGETEDVPSTQLPEGPTAVEATVSPTGEQILARSSGNSAELVLVTADGTSRTLWSGEVPLNYSIVAMWAPSGDWILACDTRLLIVTPGDPAVIRVLVAEPTGIGDFGETDPLLPHYAVTDLDLLPAEG